MPQALTRHILLVEDDQDDVFLIKQAAARSQMSAEIADVRDGVELLRYLRNDGEYKGAPRPNLVVLDLRLPRMGGHEALAEMKTDPNMELIPAIVLSTSSAADDVERAYRNGAAGYITKPASFAGLVEALDGVGRYWFETVTPPPAA